MGTSCGVRLAVMASTHNLQRPLALADGSLVEIAEEALVLELPCRRLDFHHQDLNHQFTGNLLSGTLRAPIETVTCMEARAVRVVGRAPEKERVALDGSVDAPFVPVGMDLLLARPSSKTPPWY